MYVVAISGITCLEVFAARRDPGFGIGCRLIIFCQIFPSGGPQIGNIAIKVGECAAQYGFHAVGLGGCDAHHGQIAVFAFWHIGIHGTEVVVFHSSECEGGFFCRCHASHVQAQLSVTVFEHEVSGEVAYHFHFLYVALDGPNVADGIEAVCQYGAGMDLHHGSDVLGSPVFPCVHTHLAVVEDELVGIEPVVLVLAVAIDVEPHARAVAHGELADGHGAQVAGCRSAHIERGAVFHAHGAAEVAAAGVERGVALEGHRTGAERAVEVDGASPDIGLAGIGVCGGCHIEYAVALLHQAHAAGECSAGEVAGVCGAVDGGVGGRAAVGALHPCRHVDGEYVGCCAVGHVQCGVGILVVQQVLVVVGGVDGGAADYLGAPVGGEWRRGLCEAFHLAEEIAQVGWLVVGVHLPHHGLTVLVVVPQGIK